jgi:hypothetical protein
MTRVKESETFVDIGGYAYQNEGEVKVKLHLGEVNRALQPDDATKIHRLKKIRVYMGVEEDKSVNGNQVYEKAVKMWQDTDNKDNSGKSTAYDRDATPKVDFSSPENNNNGLTKGETFLKNMVDKIKDNQLAMWIVIVAIALLVGYSLLR